MSEAKVKKIVEKAASILEENPELKYYEAVEKAKEVIENEKS